MLTPPRWPLDLTAPSFCSCPAASSCPANRRSSRETRVKKELASPQDWEENWGVLFKEKDTSGKDHLTLQIEAMEGKIKK